MLLMGTLPGLDRPRARQEPSRRISAGGLPLSRDTERLEASGANSMEEGKRGRAGSGGRASDRGASRGGWRSGSAAAGDAEERGVVGALGEVGRGASSGGGWLRSAAGDDAGERGVAQAKSRQA
jgi:hypothetical protein